MIIFLYLFFFDETQRREQSIKIFFFRLANKNFKIWVYLRVRNFDKRKKMDRMKKIMFPYVI